MLYRVLGARLEQVVNRRDLEGRNFEIAEGAYSFDCLASAVDDQYSWDTVL